MPNQLENPESNRPEQEINLTEGQEWAKQKMFMSLRNKKSSQAGWLQDSIDQKNNLPKEVIQTADVQNAVKDAIVRCLLSDESQNVIYEIKELQKEFSLSGNTAHEAIQEAMALSLSAENFDEKDRFNKIKKFFNIPEESFDEVINSEHLPRGSTLNSLLEFRGKFSTRSLYGLNDFSLEDQIKPMVGALGGESARIYFEGIKRLFPNKCTEFIISIAINNPDKATIIMEEILLNLHLEYSIKDEREMIEGYIKEIETIDFNFYMLYRKFRKAQEKNDADEIAELKKGFENLSKISAEK